MRLLLLVLQRQRGMVWLDVGCLAAELTRTTEPIDTKQCCIRTYTAAVSTSYQYLLHGKDSHIGRYTLLTTLESRHPASQLTNAAR